MSERPIRALIVEDQLEAASVHRMFVESLPGFVVTATVTSGRAAMQSAAADPPDLLLLDLRLPDMSGLDLLRRLRIDHPATLDVIALTADRSVQSITLARLHGVRDYLVKPFSAGMLVARLLDFQRARERTGVSRTVIEQTAIDALIHGGPAPIERVGAPVDELSLDGLATALGVSREVAQRYAARLASRGNQAHPASADPADTSLAGELAVELYRAAIGRIDAGAHRRTLSPGTLAAALNVSVRQLQRAFAMHDDRIVDRVRNRRLELAAALLADPGEAGTSIEAVAARCGFSSVVAMRRTFLERYGETPRAWRKRQRGTATEH